MQGNEIWTIAEARGGSVSRSTLQIVGKSRELAEQKSFASKVVLVGGTQALADELASYSGNVLWIETAAAEPYEATKWLAIVSKLIESRGRPAAIFMAGASSGLELMPRLAARLGAGYLSSCVDLWWEGDQLAARRPVFGGKVYENVAFAAEPAVATVRPGAFQAPETLASPGAVEKVSVEIPEEAGPRVLETRLTGTGGKDLSEASKVVAGGRGMGDPSNFKLIEELASTLDAAVGASRAVVDAGWRPHDEQVGKSGRTISPELYIAAGISGAIHHVLGMNTSKVVVAINSDPDALIFQQADFGLVGDALKILPELNEALKLEKLG
jgi:electron transfer flavoprotein alpha subunit